MQLKNCLVKRDNESKDRLTRAVQLKPSTTTEILPYASAVYSWRSFDGIRRLRRKNAVSRDKQPECQVAASWSDKRR